MLGVLEYVTDAETFFKHLRSANLMVLSYGATDLSGIIHRRRWVGAHFNLLLR